MISAPDDSARGDVPAGPRPLLRRRLLLALGATAALAASAVVLMVAYTYWHLGQIPRYDVTTSETVSGEPENYLIVGSDSRADVDASDPDSAVFLDETTSGGAGQRADTIMVLRVHPEGDRIEILSIPRDLWVTIADTGEHQRINTAYGGAEGAQRLIDTIEAELGVPIHHYGEIDFRGFQGLVEEVGGVDLYFDAEYRDRHSGLSIDGAGCYTLDGTQALSFVRSRHLEYRNENGIWVEDPTGDIGRIQRQQIFMRNALAKARDRASLTNPGEYNDLIDVAVQYVRLSDSIDIGEAAAAAQRFAEFEGDTIESFTLPVEQFTTDGGAAVVRVIESEAQPVLNVFRGEPPESLAPDVVELQVLNGSGVKGQAGEATEAFEASGFTQTIPPADVPGDEVLPTTQVRYAPGNAPAALLVESYLTAGGSLVEDQAVASGRVIVETGADFRGVESEPREDAATLEELEQSATTGPVVTTTTIYSAAKTPGEIPDGTECG